MNNEVEQAIYYLTLTNIYIKSIYFWITYRLDVIWINIFFRKFILYFIYLFIFYYNLKDEKFSFTLKLI